jgi:hypothetical protein
MREVFDETISFRYLASTLASYDAERTAFKIRAWMIKKDYDVIGVRRDGVVVGYAMQPPLRNGRLGDHLLEFSDDEVVSGQMPMLEALELVRSHRRIFVSVLGEVNGIVTQSDVTRPPVRLWLFGLLMIFEMQVSRLVRARYPEDGWIPLLPTNTVNNAKKTRASLLAQGTEMELADSDPFSQTAHCSVFSRDSDDARFELEWGTCPFYTGPGTPQQPRPRTRHLA